MKEISYFKDSGNPTITVALAGINKLEWIYADHIESESASVSKMNDYRFDVLPIRNEDSNYTHCYRTNTWGNYDPANIIRFEIAQEDKLYYLTNIHDAIRRFSVTNRKYFFLDNQSDIVGLITVGNLNCKHVYLYLYNLIVQVEQALGRFIYASGLTDRELYLQFKERTESKNAQEAIQRYDDDDAKGLDYNFLEYLYLTDLCYIFKKFDLVERLGITKVKFGDIIGNINEVRTVVAHPNKSLIRNEGSIHDLYQLIEEIDYLLDSMQAATSAKTL